MYSWGIGDPSEKNEYEQMIQYACVHENDIDASANECMDVSTGARVITSRAQEYRNVCTDMRASDMIRVMTS